MQSGFTVYVPFMVTGTMLPFWLTQAVAVVPPFPSKICVPTLANGPASAGGAVMNPVTLYAKVPSRVVLEHPLSAACASGRDAQSECGGYGDCEGVHDVGAFHDLISFTRYPSRLCVAAL